MLVSATDNRLCQLGWAVNRSTGEVKCVVCGRWSCEPCGRSRRRQFLARVRRETYDRFITLTHTPDRGLPTPENLRASSRAWSRTRQYLKRKYNLGQYVWVRELTRRGNLHLHVLVKSQFVPQRELAKQVESYGFGKVTDIRYVRSDHAQGYIAKYLSKANINWPKYTRRAQTSVRDVRAPHGDWDFLRQWQWAAQYGVPAMRGSDDERRSPQERAVERRTWGGRQQEFLTSLVTVRKTQSPWQDPGG